MIPHKILLLNFKNFTSPHIDNLFMKLSKSVNFIVNLRCYVSDSVWFFANIYFSTLIYVISCILNWSHFNDSFKVSQLRFTKTSDDSSFIGIKLSNDIPSHLILTNTDLFLTKLKHYRVEEFLNSSSFIWNNFFLENFKQTLIDDYFKIILILTFVTVSFILF